MFVLELCCFLADERSCGENSDTESTTVGQFVCIFYGHTQSLPETTFDGQENHTNSRWTFQLWGQNIFCPAAEITFLFPGS